MKLLSIIVPAYNLGFYLAECLASFETQDHQEDFEVIVVDDGSSDDTLQVATRFIENHPHWKVFSQNNQGVNAAREFGLQHATGKYIWFVDGDDLIHPKALSFFESHFDRIGTSDVTIFGEISGTHIIFGSLPESMSVGLCTKEEKKTLPACNLHTVVFRKDFIKDQSFPRYTIGEDLLFIFTQFCRAEVIVTIYDALIYGYRLRDGSAMSSMDRGKLENIMQCNLEIIKLLTSDTGLQLSRNHLGRFVRQVMWHNPHEVIHQHDGQKELVILWRSVVCSLPAEAMHGILKWIWNIECFLHALPGTSNMLARLHSIIYHLYAFLISCSHG